MAYTVALPNGQTVEVPDDVSPDQAYAEIQKYWEEMNRPPAEGGFMPAVKSGFSELKSGIAALLGKTGAIDEKTATDYMAEQEAYQKQTFKPTTESWSEAPLQHIKELAGQSLPWMAAPVAAGATALALPEAVAGTAVLGGMTTLGSAVATGAAMMAGTAQYTGSNLKRQIDEGKSLHDTNLGYAAATAIPQAALDQFSLHMIPGVGKIFRAAGKEITEETAAQFAKQGLAKTVRDYAASTGKTMTVEGLTEAAQQFLERMQAGLDLNSPEARDEYWQSLVGGAVLGGTMAPVGRFFERGSEQARAQQILANKELRERQEAAAQAAAAEEEKDSPEYIQKVSDDYLGLEDQIKQLRSQLRKEDDTSPTATADKLHNEGVNKQIEELQPKLKELAAEYNRIQKMPKPQAAEAAAPQFIPEDISEQLQNPLGNFKQADVGPDIWSAVNRYRKAQGKPLLKEYSIEDIKASMPGAEPKAEQGMIDTLIAARTGFQGDIRYTPEMVLNAAKTVGVDTTTKGFNDFLRRSTGTSELGDMSQPQLHHAFEVLSKLPESEASHILPEGTNATHFSQKQYENFLKVFKLSDPMKPRDEGLMIGEIKDATGLTSDQDAKLFLDEAVKRGDIDQQKRTVYRAIDPKTNKPVFTSADANKTRLAAEKRGLDFQAEDVNDYVLGKEPAVRTDFGIEEGFAQDGKAPSGFHVTDGANILHTATSEAEAQSRAAQIGKKREGMAQAIAASIKKIEASIKSADARLVQMEAEGKTGTPAYTAAKVKIAAFKKAKQAEIASLVEQAKEHIKPLSVKPAESKATGKPVFRVTEKGLEGEFATQKEAEEHILSKASNERIAELAAKGHPLTSRRAQSELRRRSAEANKRVEQESKAAEEQKAQDKLDEAVIQDLEKRLNPLLQKFGMGDVALKISKAMRGGGVEAEYLNKVITLAIDVANPVRTMRHETLHALHDLGFFTEGQWKMLKNMADKVWIDKYLKQRAPNGEALQPGQVSRFERYQQLYGADNIEALREEAIADAFGDFDVNGAPKGVFSTLLQKLRDFFEALHNAFTGAGYGTAEGVFRKVEAGELKATKQGGGSPKQAQPSVRTDTDAFKRWFGDSKVVDGNGKPLVVYHGAKWDIEDGVFRMEKGMLGTGAYFTSNPQEADFYTSNAAWRTDANIVPAYVSIKNPYYTKDKWDKGALKAKENGHDGVILLAPDGVSVDWAIPFTPTQIKSAIGNNGQFNPTNPDIRASLRDAFKATKAEEEQADKYEEANGIRPYTSQGYLDVPVKYSIKGFNPKKDYGTHPLTGQPLNKDGTLTVYYHTTKAKALEIGSKKFIPADGKRRIYLTNESSGAEILRDKGNFDHELDGSTVLINIDPNILQIDKQYENGRMDFFIPTAQGNAFYKKMQMQSIQKSRQEAITDKFSYEDHEKRISAAVKAFKALEGKQRAAALKKARDFLKAEHNVNVLMTENGKLEKTRTGEYQSGLTVESNIASMGLGLASAQKITDKANTCPRSAICEGLCLGETSGGNFMFGGAASEDVGDISKSSFRAAARMFQYLKTEALIMHPEEFAIVLQGEIDAHTKWCEKETEIKKNAVTGAREKVAKELYAPAFRLNVTSDFKPEMFRGIIEGNPQAMFYDYTKLGSEPIAKNHHLTYSSTGFGQIVDGEKVFFKNKAGQYDHNWATMRKRLDNGQNVAMAFSSKSAMPKFLIDEETGVKYAVLNGDDYDARFLDEKTKLKKQQKGRGVIVGLKNKAGNLSEKNSTKKTGGFFVNYDPKVDGDTVTVPDQAQFKQKTIPIAKASLRSAAEAFDPIEIEKLGSVGYKKRSKLVEMSIDDFLKLAEVGFKKHSYEDVKRYRAEGKRFTNLPYLDVWERPDGNMQAEGHEGRHRARQLKAEGYETMPVELRNTPIRWSEQDDPQNFDYREKWPERLYAQKGASDEGFSIPFPVSREQAVRPYEMQQPKASLREAPDTPEFNNFYKNSKVRDADGKPIRLYTGTSKDVDFNTFRMPKRGVWFTEDPEHASQYALDNESMETKTDNYRDFYEVNTASRVIPAWVNIEKPYTLTADERELLMTTPNYEAAQRTVFQKALYQGYDGINMGDGVWVAIKSPAQIKSAIGNTGAFNPAKKDMRYSLREAPNTPEFKQFFGKSQAVDKDGKPEQLYHSTYSDFNEPRTNYGTDEYKQFGFHVGPLEAAQNRLQVKLDEDRANGIKSRTSGANIMPVYVRAENPLRLDENRSGRWGVDDIMQQIMEKADKGEIDGISRDEIEDYYNDSFDIGESISTNIYPSIEPKIWQDMDWEPGEKSRYLTDFLRQLGYDSIVYDNKFEGGGDSYILLNGSQVKSATGNKGTYSRQSKDVRASLREAPDWVDQKIWDLHLKAREADALAENPGSLKVAGTDRTPTSGELKRRQTMTFRRLNNALKDAGLNDQDSLSLMVRMNEESSRREAAAEDIDVPEGVNAEDWARHQKNMAELEKSKKYSLTGPKRNVEDEVKSMPGGAAIWNNVQQNTSRRVEQGFIERILSALAGDTLSAIRAAGIHRYNRIGEAEAIRAKMMGTDIRYADENAESAALMSDLSASVASASFGFGRNKGGVPTYKNGVTTIDTTQKGLLESFMPLAKVGDPKIYQLFQHYMAIMRGHNLDAQGKKTQYSNSSLAEAQALEQQYPEFKQVRKDWLNYNNGVMKYLVDTGVLSQEKADIFMQHADYIPFYRQLSGETVGPQIFSSIAGVKKLPKLKGGDAPLGDLLETVIRNSQAAITMGMKNVAGQRAVKLASDIGTAQRLHGTPAKMDNVITVMEKGEKAMYFCSDMLFINAVKSLNMPDIPFLNILSAPANVLRSLVTIDPGFIGANLLRDSVDAYIRTGTKMTPVVDTLNNFAKNIFSTTPELEKLYNAGILGGYEASGAVPQTAKNAAKTLRKRTGTRTATETLTSPMTGLWEQLENLTEASDAATRIAIYKDTLKRTGNEAEALFQALEVMNFHRKGSSLVVRIATAAIPFLNARLQGLDNLFRAGIRPLYDSNATTRQKQLQKTMLIRGLTLLGLSTMYAMAVTGDPEYEKQEDETRDNNWIIPFGDSHIKMPIPFEIGTLFKTLPERAYRYYLGKDTAQDSWDSANRAIRSTFAFNPMPQAFNPLYEVQTNYSQYTRRPIISQGMENIADKYQYDSNTPAMFRVIGEATGLSPKKMEHLWQGYTGTMGTYAVQLMDSAFEGMGMPMQASKRFEQMPVIKRFVADPEARGQVTAFYDLKNRVDEVVRTVNYLQKEGSPELPEYLQKNATLYAARSLVSSIDKQMMNLNAYSKQIRASNLKPDEKRDLLLQITKAQNEMTNNIRMVRKTIMEPGGGQYAGAGASGGF